MYFYKKYFIIISASVVMCEIKFKIVSYRYVQVFT